jgi:flagellar biosynthesis/type III secretory pathway protein FliH
MSNNKQQTAVEWFIEELEEKGKAYEENQVVRTINICIDVSDYMELKEQAKEMEKQQRSIELPSDEEIEKEAPYSTLGWGYEFGMNDGFKKGAKFVINKIKGGNK